MTNYDCIIIGGGITGSALSYELAKKGFKVLLLEKDPQLENATRYSYGGVAYWSGTTELTRQLCQQGRELHRNLSQELEADTEFREIELLLTIDKQANPQQVFSDYQQFAIKPNLLSVEESCSLEPLLNPEVIAGTLKFPHGHIHPQKTNLAYQQAFLKLGGEIKIEQVISFSQQGNKIEGVKTNQNRYYAAYTVVCAGGLTRSLLQKAGIKVNIYFTHAQLIKTPPTEIKLRTLVMPADLQRLVMEEEVTQPEKESLWEHPQQNLVAEVIETGAIQFLDGSICMGQISKIITSPDARIDAAKSEAKIRQGIASILPSLSKIAGTWHNCLVAFRNDSPFLVGQIDNLAGIYLFSGFTSPLVFAPPLAQHLANYFAGEEDAVMSQLQCDMSRSDE
jgi:glycine/D-amino acid oxidase-like deaminating enzyme